MATIFMLLGGLFGVFLRARLDAVPGERWRPIVVSVAGGFVLGGLTGAALLGFGAESALATAGIGLSAALTTFCVFGGATTALFHDGMARHAVLRAFTHVLSGFGAATAGVALGAVLVS